ncbi:MAG: hypothetical protein FIA89_08970 [Geobacter sp.]|nr:hypothetical protein [Geobacter sp.]
MRLILVITMLALATCSPAYAADINKALVVVFGHEGGLQCDRLAPGNWTGGKVGVGRAGCTKYGIATNSYPNLDIRNLTIKQAARIYERDYWNPLHLSELKSQGIATEVFDTAVNCGAKSSALILQKTCNHLNGKGKDYPLDGRITSDSVRWINEFTVKKSNRTRFWKLLNGYQLGRYIQIVDANPRMTRYLNSWLSRVW